MVYQRAFAAFLYQAEIPCPKDLLTGVPRKLELHRDLREIGVTYSTEQTNIGANKNAILSRKSIGRMVEAKGASDMKKRRYYITLNAEETRLLLRSLIRMKNRLVAQGRYTDCVDELIAKIAYIENR